MKKSGLAVFLSLCFAAGLFFTKKRVCRQFLRGLGEERQGLVFLLGTESTVGRRVVGL